MLWSPVLVLLVGVLSPLADAHFPRPCTTPEALDTQTCCPEFEGSPCGNATGRGACAEVSEETKMVNIWPPPMFSRLCQCNRNFDTYDCSRCKPGWKGANCTERQLHVRKEITSLSQEERRSVLSGLEKAKRNYSERYVIITRDYNDPNLIFENATVYDLFVWMHYFAGKAPSNGSRNAAHQGPAFPFWHRMFLLFMEREIRDMTGDESFFIPYWDWTRTDHCNICTKELFGSTEWGRITDSPFSVWPTLCTYDDQYSKLFFNEVIKYPRVCVKHFPGLLPEPIHRSPGNDPGAVLPLGSEVEEVLKEDTYDTSPYDRHSKNSFRNKLEGFDCSVNKRPGFSGAMHNMVHDYFNGTLSFVPIAANDPIFMLHHGMVDKIFEEWNKKHLNMTYPVSSEIPLIQRGENFMRPFIPAIRNDDLVGLTSEDLGYTYE